MLALPCNTRYCGIFSTLLLPIFDAAEAVTYNGIMNRLPLGTRVQVLSALVEGNSIRGTCRMMGVDKKTVLRLLADVGDACDRYMDETIRGLTCVRVQCDEIWSFCHAKERNLKPEMRGVLGVGDLWTWTAIDADTKLIISWHLGKRTQMDARVFISDLAQRIRSNVQISTDGFNQYIDPIQRYFKYRADHGSEVKDYGLLDDETTERRYSRLVVQRVVRKQIRGAPDPEFISNAFVERQASMKMGMRQFTA